MKKYSVVFYESPTGDPPTAKFMKDLRRKNPKAYLKCAQYVRALEENGLALPYSYCRHIEDEVWELRPEFGGVEYRLFFGSIGADRFGIVSGYQKTWNTVPSAVLRTAKRRIEEMRREYA